ncbi:MAG: hypothetical protein HY579_13315 [Nitrospinae bacterium]|nr:hypothetical protein [Nitrospinota bacterium]
MSECENKEGACQVSSAKSPCSQTEQAGCIVEGNIEMWSDSFCRAMREVQVDILKEKIRKNWGPVLDKMGDAVVAAKGTCWQSMVAQAFAQQELRDNFTKIIGSTRK